MSAILREPNVILMKLLYVCYVMKAETRWKQSMDIVCMVGCYQLKDPSSDLLDKDLYEKA
jgi:hypothetical protein